ncbi:hypothetical protein WDV06_22825 [Streptomyces racemochromogenes]|uniref:Uncharacterized protein n=1 Tax=Streptomyces racemochromogenes TaxID=67353 RepID=A0ABW7PIU7_9ACTN
MADTVHSLTAHVHELLVTHLTQSAAAAAPAPDVFSFLTGTVPPAPRRTDVAAGLHDAVARAAALGPEGAWLVAAGHVTLGGMAVLGRDAERALFHFDAAVTAGYNDCVAFHIGLVRPLHHDPRFRALYARMRVTQADLDEFFWLHQEMQTTAREAQTAAVDDVGRHDTGVSLLPQAPLPTREPDTPGVLVTRLDLAATQTAIQRVAVQAEFRRSSGNVSLSLIDGSWDDDRALRDARYADQLDDLRRRAAESRAFVERPGVARVLAPCPPLGSLTYPV